MRCRQPRAGHVGEHKQQRRSERVREYQATQDALDRLGCRLYACHVVQQASLDRHVVQVHAFKQAVSPTPSNQGAAQADIAQQMQRR
jgi:DNA-directed RNA polymerase subunit N (RpoN/RPB10)